MNVIGRILFLTFGGYAIYTLNYVWVIVGLVLRFVCLIIWLFKYCPSSSLCDRKSYGEDTKMKQKLSSHFIYNQLFNEKRGGR